MRRRGIVAIVLIAIVLLTLLRRAGNFLVDLLWFSAVGYFDTFWTIFVTKALLFLVVFASSTALLWVNGALALRFARQRGSRLPVPLNGRSASTQTSRATLPDLVASLLLWRQSPFCLES